MYGDCWYKSIGSCGKNIFSGINVKFRDFCQLQYFAQNEFSRSCKSFKDFDSSGECQVSVHHAFLFSFKDRFI